MKKSIALSLLFLFALAIQVAGLEQQARSESPHEGNPIFTSFET